MVCGGMQNDTPLFLDSAIYVCIYICIHILARVGVGEVTAAAVVVAAVVVVVLMFLYIFQ